MTKPILPMQCRRKGKSIVSGPYSSFVHCWIYHWSLGEWILLCQLLTCFILMFLRKKLSMELMLSDIWYVSYIEYEELMLLNLWKGQGLPNKMTMSQYLRTLLSLSNPSCKCSTQVTQQGATVPMVVYAHLDWRLQRVFSW